jgi:hypothetical protein
MGSMGSRGPFAGSMGSMRPFEGSMGSMVFFCVLWVLWVVLRVPWVPSRGFYG